MWMMFLRDNGRWSLWHDVQSHDKENRNTVCGWEFSVELESQSTIDIENTPPALVCSSCFAKEIPAYDGFRESMDG